MRFTVLLIFLLQTFALFSQVTFTENIDAPFQPVTGGNTEFADVDGDSDQDLVMTGGTVVGNYDSKLYLNDFIIITTSISEQTLPDIAVLYPNPALDGKVNLSYSSPKNTVLDISILDLSGKTLSKQTVIANAGENILPLDLGALNKGIYIIRLTDGESTLPLKFVIK
jgi:hypothetical protein